jgi:hypothetical protein
MYSRSSNATFIVCRLSELRRCCDGLTWRSVLGMIRTGRINASSGSSGSWGVCMCRRSWGSLGPLIVLGREDPQPMIALADEVVL